MTDSLKNLIIVYKVMNLMPKPDFMTASLLLGIESTRHFKSFGVMVWCQHAMIAAISSHLLLGRFAATS